MTTDPLLLLADRLAPSGVDTDPVAWVRDQLGEHLWSKQAEIAWSVRDNRRTAVHSAHDTGKSWVAARVAAWWMATHQTGDAFLVTTAPTGRQVRNILWREIARAHRQGGLPGRLNLTEWWIDQEIVGFGASPSDYDPTTFQGIHARAVLVVIDEACGVPSAIWDACDSLITSADSRILAVGNPDDPLSEFERVCRPGSGWNVIHVDGLATPNFTDEDVPAELRPLLLSPTWVDEKRSSWGELSPLWVAKVRGEFPVDADDGVVPLSWVRRCQTGGGDAGEEPVVLGVDVGAGGDETVIRERRGRAAGRVWRTRSPEAMEVAGLIVRAARETAATRVNIDSIGIGWGVAGRAAEVFRERGSRVIVTRVNVAETSRHPSRFANLRAEIWWMARELSQGGGWDLSGVDDGTVAQLVAPRYALDSAGRVRVEPKDQTRKRLGRSPDDADALLLAFYGDRGRVRTQAPQRRRQPMFADMWDRRW